jgi:hypothetical protein
MGNHTKRLIVVSELKKEIKNNNLKFTIEYLNYLNDELKTLITNHCILAKANNNKKLDSKVFKKETVVVQQ